MTMHSSGTAIGTPGEASLSKEQPAEQRADQSKSAEYKCLESCYALALRSAAEYVVDLEPVATREFQRHVHYLEERVAGKLLELWPWIGTKLKTTGSILPVLQENIGND